MLNISSVTVPYSISSLSAGLILLVFLLQRKIALLGRIRGPLSLLRSSFWSKESEWPLKQVCSSKTRALRMVKLLHFNPASSVRERRSGRELLQACCHGHAAAGCSRGWDPAASALHGESLLAVCYMRIVLVRFFWTPVKYLTKSSLSITHKASFHNQIIASQVGYLDLFVIFVWTLFFHVRLTTDFVLYSWSWMKVWCAKKCGNFVVPPFPFWPNEIWYPLTLINVLYAEAFKIVRCRLFKVITTKSFVDYTDSSCVELSEQFSVLLQI